MTAGFARLQMRNTPHVGAIRAQQGAALLAFMLVVVVGASFVLISDLNAMVRQYSRQGGSSMGLQQAREALIAYAVNYPEHPGSDGGPGYLPCPDFDNDGQSECSPTGAFIGRLPWTTLNIPEVRDHVGERLWYAVSPNFDETLPLNIVSSDTQGTLSVDGSDDIVAVIFAPGPPVGTQDRASAPLSTANYLEGGNEDGDATFFSRGSGEFNDQVVFITRSDLVRAVEKRVLGDVAQMLNSYRDDADRFPALSPFDPTAADYDRNATLSEGQLAFNDIGETFETDFTVDWVIDAGGSDGDPFTITGTAKVPTWYDVSSLDVNLDSLYYGITDGIDGPACVWGQVDGVTCYGRARDPDPVPLNVALSVVTPEIKICFFGCITILPSLTLGPVPLFVTGVLERHYDISISIPADGVTTPMPDATYGRVRNVAFNESALEQMDGASIEIKVTDSGSYTVASNIFPTLTNQIISIDVSDTGQVSASINAFLIIQTVNLPLTVTPSGPLFYENKVTYTTTTASIGVQGIAYDLGVGDEIPPWFTANGWHDLAYVAYPTTEGTPGATASSCVTLGVDCVTVTGSGAPNDQNRAVAVIAGSAIAASQARPSSFMDDYYEGDNNNICVNGCATSGIFDNILEKASFSDTFNDQIRVVLAE